MTNKEIENRRKELIQILNIQDSGKTIDIPNSAERADSGQVERFEQLHKLALVVGASHKSTERQKTANEGELVVGIQAALQTALMLNTCKAARTAWIVAGLSALASIISAIAAWAAIFEWE